MWCPVLREDKVVAILGVGNKHRDYTQEDVEIVSYLADVTWEIVRKKQSEVSLSESERKYKELVDNANSVIIRWKSDGSLTFFNEYAQRFFGYRSEEVLGKRVGILVPERDSTGGDLSSLVQDIVNHPERYANHVNENVCKNGSRVWMAWTNKPIFDDKGQVSEILAVGSDSTSQKRTERALQESDERYRRLFDHAPIMYVITRNEQGAPIISDCNDLFLRTVGCPREEVLKRPLADFYTAESKAALLEGGGYARALAGQYSIGERQLVSRNGEVVPTLLYTLPESGAAGAVIGTRAMFVDITELKVAEEALNLKNCAVESSISGISIADLDGNLIYVNKAALDLWGYDNEEEVLGKRALGFWATEKEVEEAVSTALKTGSWIDELVIKRKDGCPLDVQAAIALVKDTTGRPVAMMGSFLDISERKQAHEAILRAKNEWERTFDAVPDLISIFDKNHKILRVNRAMAESLNLSPDEAVEKTCYQVVQGAECPPDFCPYVKMLMDGGLHSVEIYEEALGGHFLVTVSPLHDTEGNLVGCVHIARNISDQKDMEKSLRDSEEKFSRAFELAPMPMAITSMQDGRLIEVNEAFLKGFGYEREEVLGKKTVEIGTWKDEEERTLRLEQIKRDGALLNSETDVHTKNGTLRHGLFSAVMIHLQGEPMLLSAFNDTTEQKKAEEDLRASEQMMKSILVASPVGLCLTKDGIITWANAEWGRMFGFLDEFEYVGQPTSIMYGTEAQYMSSRKTLYEDLDTGTVGETYIDFVRRDGSQFHGYLRATYIDPSDPRKGTLSAISDLTEIIQARQSRLESEERYRSLFQDSRDPVFVTTRDGKFLEANGAFSDLFGYSRKELETLTVEQTYADPIYRRVFQEAVEKTGSTKDLPLQVRKKDGTELDTLLTASVRYGKQGEVLGYQGVIRDVTEKKQLEKQLLQAQKMEAIGTLAGGIAHDFNNILQVAVGYSDLLLGEAGLPEEWRSDIQKINESASLGADLVKRLLTFGRKADTQPQPLNLNHRINGLRAMLERTIPKMIDIQLFLGDRLARIHADPTQVDQLLMNLAVNARDAMPEGGKLIFETTNVHLDEEYVKTHVEANPGDYVLLMVTDTGSGMDPETLERIFEPFYTTKAVGEGTGLGLAMVHGIVKQHGGHIECRSEPGKGTAFRIYFPAESSDEEGDQTEVMTMPQGGTETILLVDDEEHIRELGSKILQKSGYKVIKASNGKEALDVFRTSGNQIDLVVLDLIMPEMGGKQCIEGLLRLDPLVKVIIASGYSANGPTKNELAAGTKGFINKPYKIRQMMATVREVLDAE